MCPMSFKFQILLNQNSSLYLLESVICSLQQLPRPQLTFEAILYCLLDWTFWVCFRLILQMHCVQIWYSIFHIQFEAWQSHIYHFPSDPLTLPCFPWTQKWIVFHISPWATCLHPYHQRIHLHSHSFVSACADTLKHKILWCTWGATS